MKLLLFSDLHESAAAARALLARAAAADVLVGAGDFANMHHDIRRCLDILAVAAKPTVLVAGNNETVAALRAAVVGWPAAHVLHGSGVTIGEQSFYGFGGGVPVTPFGDWSFDLDETTATRLLAGCPAGAVLVSHSPPHGLVDRDSSGRSLGSTAVRTCVEARRPVLVVCGHIHACAGQTERLGGTPVVNAGPGGVAWEL